MQDTASPRNSDALLAELRTRAKAIRRNVILQARGKGQAYAGQGLQSADLFAALFFSELYWSAERHADPARDRFLLSVGHYAITLYAAFVEAGLLAPERLGTYAADGSALTMGTEPGELPGVEFAGGSLGQGLGVAAGLAWGLRHRRNSARVFNYMSDGEIQEGSTWEAAMFASARGLDRLVNIIDVNRTQADGDLALEIEPLVDKFRAFGWWAEEVDGNDLASVLVGFDNARHETARPKALICHTRIGFGSPSIMARPFAHFVRIGEEEWDRVASEVEAAP